MKHTIIILLLAVLCSSTYAQQPANYYLSLAGSGTNTFAQQYTSQAPSSFASGFDRSRPHMCGVAMGGLITMGVGLTTFCIGFGQYVSPGLLSDGDRGGADIASAGALIFIVGSVVGIGGGIHDAIEWHRVSLIVTKNNEVGIAWKF